MNTPPLQTLPPELFPIIAAHLPLHSSPQTLLALASSCRSIFEIVYPILYSCIVLEDESEALVFLQRLLHDPHLGQYVREFHIMSELSEAVRTGEPLSDMISILKRVIESGKLPYLCALGLHFRRGWDYYYSAVTDDYILTDKGKLCAPFWTPLKEKCPRLQSLTVSGVRIRGYDEEEEENESFWMGDSGIFEIEGITILRLHLRCYLSQKGTDFLLKNISLLCHQLSVLELSATQGSDKSTSTQIFALNLPMLRTLRLRDFQIENVSEPMAFWIRHPWIENLSLPLRRCRGFADEFPSGLFPKLKHLEAQFEDILALAPLLNQLISLTALGTINAQIPYLVRSVLPSGLLGLRSLGIYQLPTRGGNEIKKEGGLWFETEDGQFRQQKAHKALRNIDDMYMKALVKGTPNLEEINLWGNFETGDRINDITEYFSEFQNLKRVCFRGPQRIERIDGSSSEVSVEDLEAFLSDAWQLAETCPRLESVTDIDETPDTYLTARIRRDVSGNVVEVREGRGFGMQIGREDDPFPPER